MPEILKWAKILDMFVKGVITTPLRPEFVNVERLFVVNHHVHLRTLCRSLLVCIYDNTAVPA